MMRYEYRITRPSLYPLGSAGHNDPSAREGHYVVAATVWEACEVIRERLGLEFHEPLEPVAMRAVRGAGGSE